MDVMQHAGFPSRLRFSFAGDKLEKFKRRDSEDSLGSLSSKYFLQSGVRRFIGG